MSDTLRLQEKVLTSCETATTHIGDPLWASRDGCFAVRQACGQQGQIIYMARPVGDLPSIPLVLVIGKRYAAVDRLLCDEPRPVDHAERLFRTCCYIFARRGVGSCVDAQRIIVVRSWRAWHDGHPLLERIATACNPFPETAWPAALTAKVFGDRYYARFRPTHPLLELKYARTERGWLDEGRKPLPSYFAAFGVLNAERYVEDRQARASEEAKKVRGHEPSSAETQAIGVLMDAFAILDPDLCAAVRRHPPGYRVADTEFIMGTLRVPKRVRHSKVYLCWQIFTFDFSRALAVFVHEHSHVFGCDGSREFTDQLTWLLEAAVRRRRELDNLEARWQSARDRCRKVGAEVLVKPGACDQHGYEAKQQARCV